MPETKMGKRRIGRGVYSGVGEEGVERMQKFK